MITYAPVIIVIPAHPQCYPQPVEIAKSKVAAFYVCIVLHSCPLPPLKNP